MAGNSVDLLSELIEKISLNNFEPGNEYWVHVTHITNPHSFYVRPTAYLRFLDEIEACGDPMEPENLNVRAPVVYYSETLNKFIRGLVCFSYNEETTTCDMFAMDYGFYDKSVEMKKIFKSKTCNIPSLVAHCSLAECKPIKETWREKDIDAMKYYVGEERAKMFIYNKNADIFTVSLQNTLPDHIAKMLALTGYSYIGFGSNTVCKYTAPEPEKLFFTFKELKPNDVLHVRVQTGHQLNAFFVAEKKEYQYYLTARDNLTYVSKKMKRLAINDLLVDQPVAVFRESSRQYERAIIREILADGKVKVQFVDLGHVAIEDISSLKPMEKFFHFTAVALYCCVTKEQIAEPKYKKLLYPGSQFRIEIIEPGDKFVKPNIVKIID